MFFRTKTSGPRSYLQIVENHWEDGRPRQRVIATLGRLDQLQQSGQLDALLVSGARLAQSVLLLSTHAKGQLPTITPRRIGPPSSSSGSGARRGVNGLSSNSWRDAASSATSSGRSS